jgi:VanZ family protein
MADVPVPLMKRRRLVIAANVVYAFILLTLGLISDVPTVVSGVPDLVAHAAAYAVQAVLLFILLVPSLGRWKAALLSAVGAVVFGGLVEALQLIQPARSVELRDLAANTVGAAMAASILYLVTELFVMGQKR